MRCEACDHDNIDGARFCAKCGALMPPEETGEDPLVGQVIGGRYRITGVLGEGGMGIVYVGEQQMGSTVRKVAVKTLHAHLSKDPSVLARFHRECGTVAQLEHPNTIKFFDFGATEDGTLYIAMEFVKGKPLSDIIEENGAMGTERVLKIMKQISGALNEAHGQGIVHRDLKPENVILTTRAGEADFVKVLDFGIAARTESADQQREQKLTQQGMVLGTPPYMSPEQFTGKELDRRSDIYSLGVMAYEMLTGRLPFEADTPWQWATQHMTAQPAPFEASAPNADIPDGIRRAILKSLSKDREDRHATAKDFYGDLEAGAGLGAVAVPVPASVDDTGTPVSMGSAGTAAMAAVPDFGGVPMGAAPMGAPPMGTPPMGASMGGAPAVPMGTPGGIPPAPPPTERRGGSGIVVALVAVGVLLLGAIGVVAAMSMGGDDDDVDIGQLGEPDPTESGTTQITSDAPTADAPKPDTTPTAPDGPATPTETGATSTETSSPPPKTETAKTTPTPTSPTTAKTETKTSGPSGGAACAACIAAARSGNISGAVANYNRCDSAAQKQQCGRQASGPAQQAADAAALNGNCAQAKQIANSAASIGARVRVPRSCR